MVAVNPGTRRMGEASKFTRPPEGIHCYIDAKSWGCIPAPSVLLPTLPPSPRLFQRAASMVQVSLFL